MKIVLFRSFDRYVGIHMNNYTNSITVPYITFISYLHFHVEENICCLKRNFVFRD